MVCRRYTRKRNILVYTFPRDPNRIKFEESVYNVDRIHSDIDIIIGTVYRNLIGRSKISRSG